MNAICHSERYLVCVTENNNNKFYRMKDNNDGTFTAIWGRIGTNGASCSYPARMWDAKYAEKIRKGYTDQSSTIISLDGPTQEKTPEKTVKEEEKPGKKKKMIHPGQIEGVNLLSKLARFAKSFVKRNYITRSSAVEVNEKMLSKVDELLCSLAVVAKTKDVAIFNQVLSQVFMAIPRVMSDTRGYYAKNPADFTSIVQRECDFIDSLRGMAKTSTSPTRIRVDDEDMEEQTLGAIEKYGLKVETVSESEKAEIKALMGSESSRYVRAWRITNRKTKEAFDKYISTLKDANIVPLWHGSRNENFHSILCTGLQTKPNAKITGKMFGYGIYFAPSFMKSLGYTSINGSYWARGRSDVAYMAIFDVALGKSLNVNRYDSNYYNYTDREIRARRCNSLWAHKGAMLRNDEIIVYREDATTIKYLVEIG